MSSRQESTQPPFSQAQKDWLTSNAILGHLCSDLHSTVSQTKVSQPECSNLAASATTACRSGRAVHRDFPGLVVFCRLDDSRELVIVCSLTFLALRLTQPLVIDGKIALPATRIQHYAAQQLHLVVDCSCSNLSFDRRADFRAPLLLLLLNQPQVNCLYSCI